MAQTDIDGCIDAYVAFHGSFFSLALTAGKVAYSASVARTTRLNSINCDAAFILFSFFWGPFLIYVCTVVVDLLRFPVLTPTDVGGLVSAAHD